MTDKKRCALVDVLRVVALLLVLNAHLSPLYPIPAPTTVSGAGIGLFFILSGFCLRIEPSFLRHMGRRAARLYPGVWIAVIGSKAITGLGDALRQFIWPTAFWFVGAILLFDALIYLLERIDFTRYFGRFTLVMAVLYVACLLIAGESVWRIEEADLAAPQQCFRLICCFYIFAMGYTLRKRGVPACLKGHTLIIFIAATGLGLFSFALKPVMVRFPATTPLQLLTPLAVVGFTLGALVCALEWEERWTRISPPWLRRFFAAFAAISLEMYLVQFPLINSCKALSFPINVATAMPLILLFAIVLNAADRFLCRQLLSLGAEKH